MDSVKYYTHHNYDRPFLVEISKLSDKDQVKIYKKNADKDEYDLLLEHFTDNVYIGKSPLNEMTEFSGGHGDNFDGNSILLHLVDNHYLFIGHEIFSFEASSTIVKYVSPVGNNDVPYPYAIDVEANYYLMIENVVLTNSANNSVTDQVTKYNDPYNYYYKMKDITPDLAVPFVENIEDKFSNISEFYIDNDPYTLIYTPDPAKNYDRLIPEYGNQMYIVCNPNEKTLLTKDMYIDLIENFGNRHSFKPMKKVLA